jgi:4-amino-4-deoxy-L-arabinose transferase
MWTLLPLAFLSLSRGKLPTYILPCLLPLALLMANALVERLKHGQVTALRLNGGFYAVAALVGLLVLLYLQWKNPVYDHEPIHLLLAIGVLTVWMLTNVLQALRPLSAWAMPAAGSLLLVALLPAALPYTLVYDKTPDQFVARHFSELAASQSLLSNDLGAASALAWRLKRSDIAFFNTVGELKYGLDYPDARQRKVGLKDIDTWMTEARHKGQVAVIMRGDGKEELRELGALPKGGKRYEEGDLVIVIYGQSES